MALLIDLGNLWTLSTDGSVFHFLDKLNADSILAFPFFIDLKSVWLIFVSSETKYTKIQIYQEKLLHR